MLIRGRAFGSGAQGHDMDYFEGTNWFGFDIIIRIGPQNKLL